MKLKTTVCAHIVPPPHTHMHLKKLFFPPSLLTAVKNQVTGNFILNAKSEDAESKTFIENGLQWEYTIDSEKETLKTTGPLHEGIVVLVSGTGSSLFAAFIPPSISHKLSSPHCRSFPRKKTRRSA